MTVKSVPFFSNLPPPEPCHPHLPALMGSLSLSLSLSLHFPSFSPQPSGWEHNPSLYFFPAPWIPLLTFLFSFLLLLSPPSCEIAVVSYGFLFLRDGRWVHVGVEATKHAVSAQRAVSFLWTRQPPCSDHYQEYAHSRSTMVKDMVSCWDVTVSGYIFRQDL